MSESYIGQICAEHYLISGKLSKLVKIRNLKTRKLDCSICRKHRATCRIGSDVFLIDQSTGIDCEWLVP